MAEYEKESLAEYFPRIKAVDVLPSPQELSNFRYKFKQTWEWWNMINNVPIERRGNKPGRTLRMRFSSYKPAIFSQLPKMFGNEKPITSPHSKDIDPEWVKHQGYLGTALHEVAMISQLVKLKSPHEAVLKSLPTYEEPLAVQYADAISESKDNAINIWNGLQAQDLYVQRLIKHKTYWFDMGLPVELLNIASYPNYKELLEFRQEDTVQQAAQIVDESIKSSHKDCPNKAFELLVMQSNKKTPEGQARAQVGVSFDDINLSLKGNKILHAEARDLKTGKAKLSKEDMIEALFMHYLLGHAIDWINLSGGYDIQNKPFITKQPNDSSHKSTNYDLGYDYLNLKDGTITTVLVNMTQQESAELWEPYWQLCMELAIAYRNQIDQFLLGNIDHLTPHFETQQELWPNNDFNSNEPPSQQPKPKNEYKGPMYEPGVTHHQIPCPLFAERICNEAECTRIANLTRTITVNAYGRGIVYEKTQCSKGFLQKPAVISQRSLRRDQILKD